MNHREGRFGTQEATAITTVAIIISGIFSIDNSSVYKNGNVIYYASAVGIIIAGIVFALLIRGMNRQRASSLLELTDRSYGWLIGLALISIFLLSAIFPLFRFLQIMTRFIFVEAEYIDVSIYFLIAMVLIAALGMEIIARAARVLVWVTVLSVVIALLVASPVYSTYRLYPLFGVGAIDFLSQVASSTLRYLAPLCALLIVNNGAHGTKSTKKAGLIALVGGGALTIASLFALAMTYFYYDLASMSAPFYRMTMEVRFESPALRTDKALLFIWTMGAMLVAAYYVYCAALVFVRTFKVGDVRPVAAGLSCISITGMLLMHFDSDIIKNLVSWLYLWSWAILLVPLVLLIIIANLKRRRTA